MSKSIIDKIKKSVEAIIGDGRFYYNDGEGLNIEFDNANFPLAFAQLIQTGAVQDTLGQYFEQVSVGIFFANTADVDLEPLANERILTDLKKSAFQWLASLRLNDELTLTNVNGTDRVYIKTDSYDVRLTAFVVNVTITENEGFGVCELNDCDCGGC